MMNRILKIGKEESQKITNKIRASGKHIKKGEKICLYQMLVFMKKKLMNMS